MRAQAQAPISQTATATGTDFEMLILLSSAQKQAQNRVESPWRKPRALAQAQAPISQTATATDYESTGTSTQNPHTATATDFVKSTSGYASAQHLPSAVTHGTRHALFRRLRSIYVLVLITL